MVSTGARRWHAAYLSVIIIAAIAAGYWASGVAVHRASHALVTVTQLCQAINDRSARQVLLWEHIIVISSAAAARETPAQRRRQRAADAEFIVYVRRLFAARDCVAPLHPRAPAPPPSVSGTP